MVEKTLFAILHANSLALTPIFLPKYRLGMRTAVVLLSTLAVALAAVT